MKIALLGLALLFANTAFSAPVPKQPPFPLRWPKSLGLESLEDLPKALKKNVGDEAMELTNDFGSREVSNCVEYLEAKKDGFSAPSSFVMAQETWFRSRCRVLEALQDVNLARRGFLRTLKLDPELPKVLPVSFEEVVSSDGAELVQAAEERGDSWATFNKNLEGKSANEDELELRDTANEWVYMIRILARGDFDNDGTDDMIVAVSTAADKGTHRSQSLLLLTREDEKRMLKVVRKLD